jgi:hypothetical protein
MTKHESFVNHIDMFCPSLNHHQNFYRGGRIREGRTGDKEDLDGVSRELGSWKTILEFLVDDINESRNVSFRQTLQKQIAGRVTSCSGAVADIEETLKKHEGGKVAKAAQWDAFGKGYIVKLGSSLEAHQSALEIL